MGLGAAVETAGAPALAPRDRRATASVSKSAETSVIGAFPEALLVSRGERRRDRDRLRRDTVARRKLSDLVALTRLVREVVERLVAVADVVRATGARADEARDRHVRLGRRRPPRAASAAPTAPPTREDGGDGDRHGYTQPHRRWSFSTWRTVSRGERSAVAVSRPRPPSMTSRWLSRALNRSLPVPPIRRSRFRPPVMTSWPAPPSIVSLPF